MTAKKKFTRKNTAAKSETVKKKDRRKKMDDKTPITEDFVNFQIFEAKYKTRLTKIYENRKPYTPKDNSLLLAVIPGTILKIYKQENTVVKEGDRLLVLEAMKMKNQILSPVDGLIKKIHVKEGDIVPKNELLISFEIEEEEIEEEAEIEELNV